MTTIAMRVCLAKCVVFNGKISLLYSYTVIRYTRGRNVRISRNPQLDVLVSVYRSVRNRFLSREINTCVNNQTDN